MAEDSIEKFAHLANGGHVLGLEKQMSSIEFPARVPALALNFAANL